MFLIGGFGISGIYCTKLNVLFIQLTSTMCHPRRNNDITFAYHLLTTQKRTLYKSSTTTLSEDDVRISRDCKPLKYIILALFKPHGEKLCPKVVGTDECLASTVLSCRTQLSNLSTLLVEDAFDLVIYRAGLFFRQLQQLS